MRNGNGGSARGAAGEGDGAAGGGDRLDEKRGGAGADERLALHARRGGDPTGNHRLAWQVQPRSISVVPSTPVKPSWATYDENTANFATGLSRSIFVSSKLSQHPLPRLPAAPPSSPPPVHPYKLNVRRRPPAWVSKIFWKKERALPQVTPAPTEGDSAVRGSVHGQPLMARARPAPGAITVELPFKVSY